jgi:hypothetical protein
MVRAICLCCGHLVTRADHRHGIMTPTSDEPTAQAQAIIDQMLRLVTKCRVVLRSLERGEPGESKNAEAERILYFTLDERNRHWAHQADGGCPPGHAPREPAARPMGAELLQRQEQKPKSQHE